MKISIGESNKLYTHKHRPTCNTSASFGDVQPIFCKKLHGKDSININLSNFVRLMPMPYPSLCNIKLKTVGRFVPCGDIAPWYDNYLSQTPFFQNANQVAFVPLHQPNIKVCTLWNLLFNNTSYFAAHVSAPTDEITPFNADYVEQVDDKSFNYHRLTQQGYIVYRTLFSLGYRPSPSDSTLVNIMPLFAYCKALWDVFGIKSNKSFEDTGVYSAIQKICSDALCFNADDSESTKNAITTLFYYIGDYSYCTLATDWIAAHQISPYGGLMVNSHGESLPDDDTYGSNSDLKPVDTEPGLKGPSQSVPRLSLSTSTEYAPTLTKIQLSLLTRLTQMFAKDSIIGLNIKDYIEKRFGSAISNALYNESYFGGKSIAHINVSDIDSLADTADNTGASPTGSYLGSYAGKGVGSGNGQFSIKADKDGYFILLQWIEPEEDYFSFLNPELQYYMQSDEARPEYDALGYELTPKSCAWTDNQISAINDTIDNSDAFGYIPRYSGWKYIPNIVSGDLRLRRYEGEMKTFYLDRDPILHQLNTNGSTTSVVVQKAPTASEIWRYLGKYPQLQNFNRIFYNSEFSVNSSFDIDGNVNIGKHVSDNFIIHNVLDVTLRNRLKPMALSYDTFIDDVDNYSAPVSQS